MTDRAPAAGQKPKRTAPAQGAGGASPHIKYYDPPNLLREKLGPRPGIAQDRLHKADLLIDTNSFDFSPSALELLQSLKVLTMKARDDEAPRDIIPRMTRPVMELKAHGAMFHYTLISEIAGVLLNFLESLSLINDDALQIITVHHQAMDTLARKRMRGAGGIEGRALAQELYKTTLRYHRKHNLLVDAD